MSESKPVVIKKKPLSPSAIKSAKGLTLREQERISKMHEQKLRSGKANAVREYDEWQ